MAFLPYSYDDGQPLPSEYVTARAAVTVGVCGALTDGEFSASAKPTHIALADAEEGAFIPTMRIGGGVVFEAPLAAASASLAPGSLADVSADGLSIAATTANKNIQIVSMDGTAKGDMCRVRFVD